MKKHVIKLKNEIAKAIKNGNFVLEKPSTSKDWISFYLVIDDFKFHISIQNSYKSILLYDFSGISSLFSKEETETLQNILEEALIPVLDNLKKQKVEELQKQIAELQS